MLSDQRQAKDSLRVFSSLHHMIVHRTYDARLLVSRLLTILSVIASFSACQSGTSPETVQALTTLEQFHLGFIDTYTAAPGKQWNDSAFQADVAKGNAMFTSATAGVTDPTRKNALEILHRQFQNDYTFLEKRAKENKPFFSPAMALAKKQTVQQDYDLARKGEQARS
jgi:hypothetical protein